MGRGGSIQAESDELFLHLSSSPVKKLYNLTAASEAVAGVLGHCVAVSFLQSSLCSADSIVRKWYWKLQERSGHLRTPSLAGQSS